MRALKLGFWASAKVHAVLIPRSSDIGLMLVDPWVQLRPSSPFSVAALAKLKWCDGDRKGNCGLLDSVFTSKYTHSPSELLFFFFFTVCQLREVPFLSDV